MESATLRRVAQCLNQCATACPLVSGKLVICLHCLSLFVALFTGVRNNLCRRKLAPVTYVVPFFGGGCEVELHNVDFVRCISMSGYD